MASADDPHDDRPEPRHPRKLAGSKWTCRNTELPFCHWVVVEVTGDDVVLQSVLEKTTKLRVPWRSLRDRARWAPGWS